MNLPKELEALRERRVWICYPMIWNPTKHSGVGGYDKPPINPYTLLNGSTDKAESLATCDEAAAQIGKTARVRAKGYDELVETPVVGVGIALSGTGICGVDFDNVIDMENQTITREVSAILKMLNTYTELSPSGKGVHALFLGKLPDNVKHIAGGKRDVWGTYKAEYQLFDSGYLTVSGNVLGKWVLAERTAEIAGAYEVFFGDTETEPKETPKEAPPATRSSAGRAPASKPASSVVSGSGFTYKRWLEEVRRLDDAELLKRIYASGRIGERVRELYDGDISAYENDHSRADQALVSYLYSFTGDRARTERLFRASALYRTSGKSREYIARTLNKAEKERVELVGHIEFTQDEKRAYAQRKEAEERKRDPLKPRRYSYNTNRKEGGRSDRRKI